VKKRLANSALTRRVLCMMQKAIFLLLAGCLALATLDAHRGRTDKNGCHVDKKTGIRHCH